MTSKVVEEYIASLPVDRQETVRAACRLVQDNIQDGYEEGVMWGGICYYIPLSVFPDTYNKQPLSYMCIASQKNHYALYMMCLYGKEEQEFREAYKATGRKLDMGKSCLRFTSLDTLPLDLIGAAIAKYTPAQYIARYKEARGET